MGPNINNFIVALTAGDNTFTVLIIHLAYFLFGISNDARLIFRDGQIRHGDGNTRLSRPDKT